jgi:peptidoglycan/xylan/chitin deacetylase (PgdA/CDA1 family)
MRVVNLSLHGIGSPPAGVGPTERELWISEELFEALLSRLAGRGSARLSFDDGNASDVEIALPALLRHHLSADFFPVAGRLGEPGYLSHDAVRVLADAGMRIGSHGMRHRPWRDLADAALEEELVEARRILGGLAGGEVDLAACPFGWYDRRVLRRLRAAGYRRIFTSDGGSAGAGTWLQSRDTLLATHDVADLDRLLRPRLLATSLAAPKRAYKRWR